MANPVTKAGQKILEENLARVRDEVEMASERSSRNRTSIRLLAVTKTVGPEVAALLPPLGVSDLGESRLQGLLEKIETLGGNSPIPLHWHMIGTVQRKKASRVLQCCEWIHSIDRIELWERILEVLHRGGEQGIEIDPPHMLIQVNISGEATKAGFAPEAVRGFLESLDPARDPLPAGLMTMAPLTDEPEDARPVFAGLAELSRRLREDGAPLGGELSMGMSGDFQVAVEEGSTIIRIGSRLFEGME